MNSARDSILKQLETKKPADKSELPSIPPLPHLSMDSEELLEAFVKNLTEQGAEVHHAENPDKLHDTLSFLVKENGFRSIISDSSEIVSNAGKRLAETIADLKVIKHDELKDRTSYKDSAFTAEAGLTSVDYAIAESGTLVICHDKNKPRLPSLSPPVHIAVVKKTDIMPVYESAIEITYKKGLIPSQATFITGPSMTADIMATPFRGMHGPKRLIVIITDKA